MGGQLCRHVCNRKAESGDALDKIPAKALAKHSAFEAEASRLLADMIEREASSREEKPAPALPRVFSRSLSDMVGHAVSPKASGRSGHIIVDDGSEFAYKVQFSDDALPTADWFKASDVELILDVGCKV